MSNSQLHDLVDELTTNIYTKDLRPDSFYEEVIIELLKRFQTLSDNRITKEDFDLLAFSIHPDIAERQKGVINKLINQTEM